MNTGSLLGLLVLGLVVLTPVADRVGVPSPEVEPDLILPAVLPSLLFAATQSASIRELREAGRPILWAVARFSGRGEVSASAADDGLFDIEVRALRHDT